MGKKTEKLPTEFLGMTIELMDHLPPDAFMFVTRLPGFRFQVILSHAGKMHTWTGTLTEANDQTGQCYMPNTSSRIEEDAPDA